MVRDVRRRLEHLTAPPSFHFQINFVMLVSRQGKVRLSRYYDTFTAKEKVRLTREISALVLNRSAKMCNVIEYKEFKVVYKRYASLFFVAAIGKDDNEVSTCALQSSRLTSQLPVSDYEQLLTLEIIHHYVEGAVCDLCFICSLSHVLPAHLSPRSLLWKRLW